MSDFYTESPVSRILRDENIILAGDRFQDPQTRNWTFTEVTLYVDFNVYTHAIQMSIWDSEKREYELEPVLFGNHAPLQEKLSEINVKYPSKVKVQDILDKARIYFDGIGESVYIEDKVTDYEADCEQCGDYNVDNFTFQYFPSVAGSALKDASLDLHWNFGCYGGIKIHGPFDENAKKALETLYQMYDQADEEYLKEIQDAIDTVEKHMK